MKIVVAMLTFKRPAEIALGLPLVLLQVARLDDAAVLIVDNDPEGSARKTVERIAKSSPVAIRYVVEPTPGIAAGRNRAIDESASADILVFIDDDEHPTASWLAPLLETRERSGAAAVMGRVESSFDSDLDPWVAAGEFFRRRSMPTGTEITVAAAGNLLLDLRAIRSLGVRFDERLELGAGEDSLFSHELVARGGRIAWCEESVAVDRVPIERMSRRWVLARARSHGNAETIVELRLARSLGARLKIRSRAALRGAARVVVGSVRFSWGVLSRSLRHQARGLRTANRGIGIMTGAAGVAVREYAR